MATLQALAISGIRSYNPEKLQRIDFTHPLTLINGKNGSGKTTIIECLKYITTGVLPPSVNRENCFVMDPSIAGTAQVKGDIRLRFRTAKNRVVIAKKVFMVTKTQKKLSSKAIEQSLKTKDDDGKQIQVSQRCADIEKQIPEMLGISKPILNNIVFCHQDDSLWPFSENNVLKNIFDELFDTKRFTKALENMKDAIKDYQKQKLQLKGQIQYLKSSYYKTAQNRTQTLLGLIEVVQATKQLRKIQVQLEPIRKKIKQLNSKQTNKNQLIGKKGVLEYKIIDINQKMGRIEERMEICGMKLEIIDSVKGRMLTEKYEYDIVRKEKQAKLLQTVLQETKDKQATHKRKTQFYMEIKRIKQIMPELKDLNPQTSVTILNKITEKLKIMRQNQKQLREEKQKYNKILLPSINLHEDRQDSKQVIARFERKKAELEQLEMRIRVMYSGLYNSNVDQNAAGITNQSKRAGQRLNRLQAQLEMKKAQLKKYQEMKPPKGKTIQNQIFELKYAGIDFQRDMLQFVKRKRQCGFCMTKLRDDQIETIKIKTNKNIAKAQNRIRQLQANYRPQSEIDPTPMIKDIQAFIDSSTKTMKILEEEKQCYDHYVVNQQQIELNRQLNKLMSGIQIRSDMSKNKIKNQQKTGVSFSIEKFRELCNQYRVMSMQYKNLGAEVQRNKQRAAKIEQMKKQYSTLLATKLTTQNNIEKLENSTRDLYIIENVYSKISELHQLIQRDDEKSSNSEQSSAQLTDKLGYLQEQLRTLKKDRENLQLNIQYSNLDLNRSLYRQELGAVIEELNIMNSFKNQNNELQNKKNTLQLEQAKLSQKINLKKSLHNNYLPQQSTYLAKQLRYNTLCSMISDIQSTMKSMQRATNRLHNEKMDQINKILFDIWQGVYHAKDIQFIRINSVSEKKNSGFGYSIMMQKNNQLIQMKGRCSMGQKVLASLIIRMALAEAFSASTHILTLDEPTTNLDRIHIQKLADSISDIIQMQQNSRLQLIIISHDMQFISLLKKHTSYYYEIGRNQKNFSTIKKKQIGELNQEVILPRLEAVHY